MVCQRVRAVRKGDKRLRELQFGLSSQYVGIHLREMEHLTVVAMKERGVGTIVPREQI